MLQVSRPAWNSSSSLAEYTHNFCWDILLRTLLQMVRFDRFRWKLTDTIPQCAPGRAITIKEQSPRNQLNLGRGTHLP